MGYWRFLMAGVVALSLVGIATVSVGAEPRDTLIQFDSMTGIGAGAPTERNLAGGGFPWVISGGTGTVDRQGDVDVTVTGLVLGPGAPSKVIGTSAGLSYSATVSCLTPDGVINVTTAAAPTTLTGDSTIDATVALPHPCKSPELFVGAVIGGHFRWFAVSNSEGED